MQNPTVIMPTEIDLTASGERGKTLAAVVAMQHRQCQSLETIANWIERFGFATCVQDTADSELRAVFRDPRPKRAL